MSELQIPCAEAEDGRIVRAEDAVSGELYRCPPCAHPLVLRAGPQRRKHFAHPSGGSCSYESVIHQAAKQLLANLIDENSSGSGVAIVIEKTCKDCDSKYDSKVPDKLFTASGVEVPVGKYRCDAVAYRGKEIVLAFEVLVSNPISIEKTSDLSVRWVELKAEDVLRDPYRWRPIRSHLRKEQCSTCQKVTSVATKWNIPEQLYSVRRDPSASDYIAALETCFKCGEQIPVFWWRGVPFCQDAPPEPKPTTVQWRSSKQYGGSYWSNTCPGCASIQGDNHLFISPTGPLSGLPMTKVNMPKDGSHMELDRAINHMFRNI